MTGEVAADRDTTERELAARLQSVRIGFWLTVIAAVGGEAYTLLTWDEPNRALISTTFGLALASAIAIRLSPVERILRSRWREPFFIAWSVCVIAMIGVVTTADGGTSSPFTLLFVLPLLFGALSYPLWGTVTVGTIDVVVYLFVALNAGDSLAVSLTGGFLLLCAALLCSWEAAGQATGRRHLAESTEALRASDGVSRQRARQQREVARFGQLALEGMGIDALCKEAIKVVHRTLRGDFTAVLQHLPEEGALVIRESMGVPIDDVGVRVSDGRASQSGFTLATGDAVVVSDWESERRFGKSEMLAQLGAVSGVTVLIRARGRSFGVLGLSTTTHRDFAREDIDFMQAIANVLANAVERRAAEERTRHEALHDPLTGLPNRSLFRDRLGHALSQAGRRGTSIAVLFLDLDGFKLVNDSLGHVAGDELLRAVALRFQRVVRPGDTVARFGGDEFAILVEDVAAERDATRVAERIAESLARPFILRQREHFVSVSTGISIGQGSEEPEALVHDADAALYRAKERGRGGYEIFDSVMRARARDHMRTEDDLRRALDRQELELHYQPIVSLRDDSVVALEALLRWRHPERGLLHPPSFVNAAEDSQLIVPIGRWVCAQACRAAASWQALQPDRRPVHVAFNVSTRQLSDPQFARTLEGAIESSGIEPVTVTLELNEEALFDDGDPRGRRIEQLKPLGVQLLLDNFGVGFSSLSHLQRNPLDAVKLDRAFVEHVWDRAGNGAIVEAMVEMAAVLGLEVVAAGIETAEQRAEVQRLGCDQAQGYYFSPPVPGSEVGALLVDPPWQAGRSHAGQGRLGA
jgi:diguanylate cyclase (GGDEF)-like protein